MADDRRVDLTEIDLELAATLDARADRIGELAADSAKRAGKRKSTPAEAKRLRERAQRLRDEPPHAGQWVQFKAQRTYGDVLKVRAASRRVGDDGRFTPDPEGATRAAIAVAIEEWSFEMPVEPASVDELKPEVGEFLDRAVGERFSAFGEDDDADTKG